MHQGEVHIPADPCTHVLIRHGNIQITFQDTSSPRVPACVPELPVHDARLLVLKNDAR